MTVRPVLFAAAILAAAPAAASVTVIGDSAARVCYEAARSGLMPTPEDFATCDRALTNEALSGHDVVATHVNRGILRLRRGNVDAAIADFDAAIALDPREPEAYLNRGSALLRQERAAEALPLLNAALERNTREPALAYFARAIANESLGNVAAAYADYRRASELKPDWRAPRAELSRFSVRSN